MNNPSSELGRPPTLDDLLLARSKVSAALEVTPLTAAPSLSQELGGTLHVKWDLKLRTGSFKERGVVNFLESLKPQDRKVGVCAGSAGNHARALSYHAARMGIPCHIVMPATAPLVKVDSVSKLGARVTLHGTIFDDAYNYALNLSQEHGYRFVPGFDDWQIVAGQASCGFEILEQLPTVKNIIVPIGGGGLISGIALAAKLTHPKIRIIGVQSEWIQCERQRAADAPAPALRPISIADGISVKKIGARNMQVISQYVDEIVAVSENMIADAIMLYLEHERTVVEGAGSATLAAVLSGRLSRLEGDTVLLACGANIDLNLLSRLIDRSMAKKDRLLRISVSVPDRPGSLSATTAIIAKGGANVMQVDHDRSFSTIPGNVTIGFLLEVRSLEHKRSIVEALNSSGLTAIEIDDRQV